MAQSRRSTSPIKETFGVLHQFCSTDFSRGTETPADRLLVVGFYQLQALDPRPVSAVGLPGPNTILALKAPSGLLPSLRAILLPSRHSFNQDHHPGNRQRMKAAPLNMPTHTNSVKSVELFLAEIFCGFI